MAKRQRQRRKERRQEHAKREGFRTRHSVITGLGVTAGAVMGLAAPAMAANITVTNNYDPGSGTCDPGGCTLREAVDLANTTAAADDIYFASYVTGTINLYDGSIGINNPVTIHGPGPGTLTIDGQDNGGIFYTNMDTIGDSVDINGLTLANGSALYGGAINDYNSTMTVNNAVLSGNGAFVGGAIYEYGAGGDLFTTFSTLNNNTAQYGGAIASQDGFGLIGGSTLAGNGAYGLGGAINAFGGRIFDSTISGNIAAGGSGGVYAYYGDSYSSILANNLGGNPDVGSPYWYSAFSLIESPGFTPIHPTLFNPGPNIIGQDPQLGGLANNGGPTRTLKPAAGSPVVDRGYSDVSVDQRFFPRPVDNPNVANAPGGNGADIGSVELTLGEGPQPPVTPAPPVVVKKKKCKKKKKHHSAATAKKKKCKKKKKHHSVAATASASQIRGIWEAQAQGGQRHGLPDRAQALRGGSDWASQAWLHKR